MEVGTQPPAAELSNMHLRQRKKDGNFTVVIDDYSTGKRRARWITLPTKSRREAERLGLELQTKARAGTLPSAGTMTVAEWLREHLATIEMAGRSPYTIHQHRAWIEHDIVPAIGHIKLARLRPEHLETFYASLLARPRRDGRPGTPGPETAARIHRILSGALNAAARRGLITSNPAALAAHPKTIHKDQKFLSVPQTQALLGGLNDDPLLPLYWLTLTFGLRRGEVLGLRWVDIDVDTKRMFIRVQRQYVPSKGIVERPTKEYRETRPLDLSERDIAVLKAHRQAQDKLREAAGPLWEEYGLVFPSSRGTPMNGRNLWRLHTNTLQRLGLPHVRFHDLRHTCASILMAMGYPINLVQQRLGHGDPATTLRMYGHVMPGAQAEASAQLGALLSAQAATAEAIPQTDN